METPNREYLLKNMLEEKFASKISGKLNSLYNQNRIRMDEYQ